MGEWSDLCDPEDGADIGHYLAEVLDSTNARIVVAEFPLLRTLGVFPCCGGLSHCCKPELFEMFAKICNLADLLTFTDSLCCHRFSYDESERHIGGICSRFYISRLVISSHGLVVS